MKCKKTQQLKGVLHKSNAPLITAIVIVLISLLTMTRFTANASAASNDKVTTESKCTECKGYNKEFLFNQNTILMKEAALNYFTDERLPQSLNDSKKLTLEEMLENKLLYKIVDSNDKACSLSDSYVEVTKLENEYLFKINLSCSDISDYILVHQGCYSYCEGNTCETKKEEPKVEPKDDNIYEYEFKKTISCVMSDWSDWSEWTTTRQTTNKNKREEIKVEKVVESRILEKDSESKTVYNCNKYEGYELIGSVCVKANSSLEEKEADLNPTSYNCDQYPGYKLVDKKCVKETTTTDEKDADENPVSYNCDKYSGYKLEGTKCVKEVQKVDEKDADKNADTYNCDKYTGYKLDGTKCVKTTTTVDEKDADENPVSYNCDKYSGYKLDGTKCIKTTTTVDEKDATPVYGTKKEKYKCGTESYVCGSDDYECGSNYECGSTVCTTTTVEECDATGCRMVPKQSCHYESKTCYQSKTCSRDKYCSKDKYCEKDVQYVTGYNCDKYSGYKLDGNKCKKTIENKDEKPADKNPTSYNCNKYSGYKLDGNKCKKTIETKDEKPADKNPTTYNCDKYTGYKLDGTKCKKTITTNDEKPADKNPTTYNCDKYTGYKLDGSKCIKKTTTKDEKDADENPESYNCDKYEGYTLVGNKCVKPKCDICTKEADSEEVKVCSDGYTLDGDMCKKTVNEEVEITYYRYSTRSCNGGSTSVKWSDNYNDSSLLNAGYKRTGNKRILVITK